MSRFPHSYSSNRDPLTPFPAFPGSSAAWFFGPGAWAGFSTWILDTLTPCPPQDPGGGLP